MLKYRRGKILIEAVQFTGAEESAASIIRLLGSRAIVRFDAEHRLLFIITKLTVIRVDPEDFFCLNSNGLIYVCAADVFDSQHEAVEC